LRGKRKWASAYSLSHPVVLEVKREEAGGRGRKEIAESLSSAKHLDQDSCRKKKKKGRSKGRREVGLQQSL